MPCAKCPPVEIISVLEATRRRAEIVAEVGGDEEAFRDRADDYLLDTRELALFEEMEALDFLMGGPVA